MFGHSIAGGLDVDDNKYDGKMEKILILTTKIEDRSVS